MVWPKSQYGVQVLAMLAQKGDVILSASPAFDLARITQQQPRLTDQVESDIRQAQILFERRRMAHPFAEPLPEHQAQVTEA